MQTTIAGFKLDSCIMNAAGALDTSLEELKLLAYSQSGAIVSKSCTYLSRTGNPHPRVACIPGNGTINSTGLANHGYQFYLESASTLKEISSKPYIVSVATLKDPELSTIIEDLNNTKDVDLAEFNLSCPNIIGKRQVGYNQTDMRKILDVIDTKCTKPYGLKLPPYFEPMEIAEVAEIIKESRARYIVCVNSLGNGLVIDPVTDKPVIAPKGGLGGIGGPSVKPFGLANVREFRRQLPDLDIVGCGGITCARDIYEYFLCGATAVSLGSYFWEHGTDCYKQLQSEFTNYLRKKGINNLSEIPKI